LVALKPEETKTISFTLTSKELGFYDNEGNFIVEPGDFKIFAGGSSNTNLEQTINL
jgi:beta-glucosidase